MDFRRWIVFRKNGIVRYGFKKYDKHTFIPYVYQYDIYNPNKNGTSGNKISTESECLCDFDQCNDETAILNAKYTGGAHQVWIIKSLDIT